MGATIVERLAECAAMIEDLSQRISRIQTGEVQHQARFAGGFLGGHYAGDARSL